MMKQLAIFALLMAVANAGYVNPANPDPISTAIAYIKTHFTRADFPHDSNVTVCWKDTIVRGAGTPIDSCPNPPNVDKSGLLCYPNCQNGYYGVGPVCWEHCPANFRDEGALCERDGHIVSADNSQCPWYDECGLVTAKGCSKCPADYHNDGCTCRIDPIVIAKKSYGRTAGVPLGCAPPKVEDASLCYPQCKANYTGNGPVCWQKCPAKYPAGNGAICCTDKETCSDKIVQLATAVITAVAAAIEAGLDPEQAMEAIKAAIEAILGFVMPVCYGV